MLSEVELSDWFQRLAIPEQGRAVIHQVRSSASWNRTTTGSSTVPSSCGAGKLPAAAVALFPTGF